MTLRLRLLLLLVGIVATGLLVSDVATYNALRSFLITRVDQQLEAAAFPVGRALVSSSGLGPQVSGAPRATGTGTTVQPGTTSTTATTATAAAGGIGAARRTPTSRRGYHFASGLADPSRATERGLLVPPGTYGQLRSAKGKVEAHLFFSYGGKAPAAPTLPDHLPGAGRPAGPDQYFSTSSPGRGSVAYRVVAKSLDGGGGVIVIAVPLTDLSSTLRQLLLIEIIVSAVVLVALAMLSWVMVRRDLRPLEGITDTAGVIARGDLSQRVALAGPGTEVGQLGRAFNTMVDEIEVAFAERAASEERLRRFLADASHELRTPLTSILGYAELFDLGVRDRPADLARSMQYIKGEASRMGTLVDDLFLLAQLDHERPLQFESVDLVDLTQRSVAGFRVSAANRTLTVEAVGPVVVEADGQRMRQVIDNLLANALVHTPDDASVDIRIRSDGNSAVLIVHDEGTGIDPADVSKIFEPFYRSDPSRARSSGGAGLGLAIVKAIVTAHRGTVEARPGEGATFEVRIPTNQTQSSAADREVRIPHSEALSDDAPPPKAAPADSGRVP